MIEGAHGENPQRDVAARKHAGHGVHRSVGPSRHHRLPVLTQRARREGREGRDVFAGPRDHDLRLGAELRGDPRDMRLGPLHVNGAAVEDENGPRERA